MTAVVNKKSKEKEIEKDLKVKISEAILKTLAKSDKEALEKVKKTIKKSSSEIAKKYVKMLRKNEKKALKVKEAKKETISKTVKSKTKVGNAKKVMASVNGQA